MKAFGSATRPSWCLMVRPQTAAPMRRCQTVLLLEPADAPLPRLGRFCGTDGRECGTSYRGHAMSNLRRALATASLNACAQSGAQSSTLRALCTSQLALG